MLQHREDEHGGQQSLNHETSKPHLLPQDVAQVTMLLLAPSIRTVLQSATTCFPQEQQKVPLKHPNKHKKSQVH